MRKRFYPQHLKRKRRKVLVTLSSVGLLALVSFLVVIYREESSKPVWEAYSNSKLGVSLNYPTTFRKQSLSDKEIEAGYILSLKRDAPNSLFSLRYETGLGPLKLLKGTILAGLVDAVNRHYPERYPDYKKESYEELTLAGEKAGRFDFTYLGADGKTRIRQRFVLVVRGEKAFYLYCQAPEKEFFKSEKDFDRIINSFKFTNGGEDLE